MVPPDNPDCDNLSSNRIWQLKVREPDATKYKCPNGRCIYELAAGKTADGWKDSSACPKS